MNHTMVQEQPVIRLESNPRSHLINSSNFSSQWFRRKLVRAKRTITCSMSIPGMSQRVKSTAEHSLRATSCRLFQWKTTKIRVAGSVRAVICRAIISTTAISARGHDCKGGKCYLPNFRKATRAKEQEQTKRGKILTAQKKTIEIADSV